MKTKRYLNVLYHDRLVGKITTYQKYFTAFQYDRSWLADGFSVSPFSLPLKDGVFIPKIDPFDGLFGVFHDSLPDGWGRSLFDRYFKSIGAEPSTFGNLTRLAYVGASGMGALTYEPAEDGYIPEEMQNLDQIAVECAKILSSEDTEHLDQIYHLAGTSGGARPKIFTRYKDDDWIVKFPSREDDPDIGLQEFKYAQCASHCGIDVSEVKLFPSETCGGYFGTKRFDRLRQDDGSVRRLHMISVSALLETSHRIPTLDYHTLLQLTAILTKDEAQIEQMFRRMCFNIFAHNRDDHSRNFSFLFDDLSGSWVLSPAYDMTYSNSLNGEHATTVNGNGRNPGYDDIYSVADKVGISRRRAKSMMVEIEEIVHEELRGYL